ncbi:MAG: DNA cytosine methyltransferase [Planctomycetales bacterium]|nr:DNA cytosine methyltransferase [Planctomycetales bacterium]
MDQEPNITFGTLCSGIEGAAVAAASSNWRQAYCAEVDPFCKKLLAHHCPEVPNLGDILKADFPPVDMVVAGTPCQSFSVNTASRAGLDDPPGATCKTGRLIWAPLARRQCKPSATSVFSSHWRHTPVAHSFV